MSRYVIYSIIVVIIISGLGYAGWVFQKKWNYYWSYENMVKQTVCDMVKPEHLKQPCK